VISHPKFTTPAIDPQEGVFYCLETSKYAGFKTFLSSANNYRVYQEKEKTLFGQKIST